MSSSTQSTSSASVASNSSTRRECLHAHWVACQDAYPSEHRSLMSPSSQSPAPSHFTPLSAITLHLPLQFSHPPTMANGVTPVLFSAAGGVSEGPLSPHLASQARMSGEADIDSRVHLLEEWMNRLERQANPSSSEQNAMEVQVETTSTTTAEPVKRCHRCKSKRHLVADCPKRRWCRPGGKLSHQAARRRQEQEEASILWDQQWSITNTEDWSDEQAEEEAYYKKYPWMRPCQKCKEPMTQTLPNWSVEPTCIFSLCLDKAHMDPFSASSR